MVMALFLRSSGLDTWIEPAVAYGVSAHNKIILSFKTSATIQFIYNNFVRIQVSANSLPVKK